MHRIPEILRQTVESERLGIKKHSEETAEFAELIAKGLNLSQTMIEQAGVGGYLHDVGKIIFPDYILNKHAPLSKQEREIIQMHPFYGMTYAKHILRNTDEFWNEIIDVILFHHERINGSGYPTGLKGDYIPLLAKIVAVADVYSAMTEERIYKKRSTKEEALQYLKEQRDILFDKKSVDALIKNIK